MPFRYVFWTYFKPETISFFWTKNFTRILYADPSLITNTWSFNFAKSPEKQQFAINN